MTEMTRRIADDPRFQQFILGVIVVGAIVIGVETSATLTARYGAIILAVETLIHWHRKGVVSHRWKVRSPFPGTAAGGPSA